MEQVDKRVCEYFCCAVSVQEQQTCAFYGPISKTDTQCKWADEVYGLCDSMPYCKVGNIKSHPVQLDAMHHAMKKEEKNSRKEYNNQVFAKAGLVSGRPGVRVDANGTWIFRLPGKPQINFYPTKNKWKDITTGVTHFGDARACLRYLGSRKKVEKDDG